MALIVGGCGLALILAKYPARAGQFTPNCAPVYTGVSSLYTCELPDPLTGDTQLTGDGGLRQPRSQKGVYRCMAGGVMYLLVPMTVHKFEIL